MRETRRKRAIAAIEEAALLFYHLVPSTWLGPAVFLGRRKLACLSLAPKDPTEIRGEARRPSLSYLPLASLSYQHAIITI